MTTALLLEALAAAAASNDYTDCLEVPPFLLVLKGGRRLGEHLY